MFERLTQRVFGAEAYVYGDCIYERPFTCENKICYCGEAIERLAAYEDSGLSPEEVHKLVKILKQARESLQAAWEDDGSTTVGKQMLEIIKAIDALMGGKEDV